MRDSKLNIETLELISIQYEVAQSLNGSLELRDFCRKYMETCLRRLSIKAMHLYLPSQEGVFNENELALSDYGRISMPKRSQLFPEELAPIALHLKSLLTSTSLQLNIELIKSGSIYYHIFSSGHNATLILERQNQPLPTNVIKALSSPVLYLFNMCNSALKHIQVLAEVERRKSAENKLAHIAYHDELTGLPNRVRLIQLLDEQILKCRNTTQQGALVYVDLDYFRDINDSLGHVIGDELLIEVASRLSAHIIGKEVLARLSSDEFVFLCPTGVDMQIRVSHLIKAITECFSYDFVIDNREIEISSSIAATHYYSSSQSAYHTLMQCDLAMSKAKKRTGVSVEFYQRDMENKARRRFMLDTDMRKALGRDEFELVVQPQVDSFGRITGGECLLRWRHPELGLIPPTEFIEIAEKTGFIIVLGDWIIEQSCNYAKKLSKYESFSNARIAINLSAKQFYQPNFVIRLQEIIQGNEICGNHLELELTESIMLENVELAVSRIEQLKALGLEVSIDDFGTGYSSLSYLKQLPIDKIKIDRSFVTDINRNDDNKTIVEAIILMASAFELKVIAEGVETIDELDVLNRVGCSEYQGYYFHKPMAFSAFLTLVEKETPEH